MFKIYLLYKGKILAITAFKYQSHKNRFSLNKNIFIMKVRRISEVNTNSFHE